MARFPEKTLLPPLNVISAPAEIFMAPPCVSAVLLINFVFSIMLVLLPYITIAPPSP